MVASAWLRFANARVGLAAAALAVAALLVHPSLAAAQTALVTGLGGPSGFGSDVLAANDDGSSPAVSLTAYDPAGLCYFGATHTSLYVNNNGNVTFDGALSAYTPTAFPSATQPMIAPWWADVDTRGTATNVPPENRVYWHVTPGQIVVTWYRVGYYNSHVDLRDSFQLVITRVSGATDYDVQFLYNQLTWTTGDASMGTGGLGGVPAQADFDAGDLLNYSTLPGSRTASILNLLTTSNTTPAEPGVWTYHFRGCALQCLSNADCAGPTPICDTGTHTCRACTGPTDCSGSTPFCATSGTNTGRCVQCLSNGNCPTDRCTANACVCASNADCSGTTPICDTGTSSCRGCTAGSATDCTGTTPVCGPTGTCVQCATGITGACMAPTPVCNPTTFMCVSCVSSLDCHAPTPYCVVGTGCAAGTVTITSPAPGATATGRTPTVTGTATPGQVLTVIIGGMTLTATADPTTGAWSVTPTAPLPVGMVMVTATLSPVGGSAPSATESFYIPCATGPDCAGATPFCDATTHHCRGCVSNADCGTGMMCDTSTAVCVPVPIVDAGVTDTGVDVAVTDSGVDTGVDASVDAGVTDTGVTDVAVTDVGMDATTDTGADASAPQDVVADGGQVPDAGQTTDAGNSDAMADASAEAAVPDGAVAGDTGPYSITGDGACACAAPGRPVHTPAGGLVATAVLALALSRRRRG